MRTSEFRKIKVREGDRVICHGYPGTVTKVHADPTDPRRGMVDVRLGSGLVTVSARELGRTR